MGGAPSLIEVIEKHRLPRRLCELLGMPALWGFETVVGRHTDGHFALLRGAVTRSTLSPSQGVASLDGRLRPRG